MAEMSRAVHAEMRGAYPELDETLERVCPKDDFR